MNERDKRLITSSVKTRHPHEYLTRGAIYEKAEADAYERVVRNSPDSLVTWMQHGCTTLDEDSYRDRFQIPCRAGLADDSPARTYVRERIAEIREDGGSVSNADAILRWSQAPAYTYFRFSEYLREQAADAARESVEDYLAGTPVSSIHVRVQRAALKWMATWRQKGELL